MAPTLTKTEHIVLILRTNELKSLKGEILKVENLVNGVKVIGEYYVDDDRKGAIEGDDEDSIEVE